MARYAMYDLRTAAEKPYIQIVQVRAQRSGNRVYCAPIVLSIIEEAR